MAAAKTGASSSLAKIPLPAKIGIIVAVVGLIAVAYVVVFYTEVSSRITAAKVQNRSLHTKLATAKQSEQAYLRDLALLTQKQQRQRDLNKILPEKAEGPSFLSAVQGVANVTGVSLDSWEPMQEVPQKFFAKVPMKYSLSGRFHQVAKFFYGVGQLDRIINVEDINFHSPKSDGDDTVVKVDCLVTAFHTIPQKRRRAAPRPGAPPPPPPGAKK